MIAGFYIVMFCICLVLFGVSFYTHNVIFWTLSLVMLGMLTFASYNIEVPTYTYNATLQAYQNSYDVKQYVYMAGVNMSFFGLALILFFYDLWTQYLGVKE